MTVDATGQSVTPDMAVPAPLPSYGWTEREVVVMPSRNGVELVFHHMGIPTDKPRMGERYSPLFGMYTADGACGTLRIQWHRFDEGSTLHPLLREMPHSAFKVADLERAMAGARLLLGPYEPIPGFRVAIIEDGGVPIELIETGLSDEQIWAKAETDSVLYRDA